tara:strand:- start:42 stop:530 length:489 start_codon:yes stop_codon:yes gene_type:complete
MECTDNILTGGIEMNLGIKGAGASIALKPFGDIELLSNLGLTGIKGEALLGDVSFATLTASMELGLMGAASLSGVKSSLTLSSLGSANLVAGSGSEVDISGITGKVTVKGKVATLGAILEELIDIITEHTHPTGTGPSGPPMAPAATKLPMLKSGKLGRSLG